MASTTPQQKRGEVRSEPQASVVGWYLSTDQVTDSDSKRLEYCLKLPKALRPADEVELPDVHSAPDMPPEHVYLLPAPTAPPDLRALPPDQALAAMKGAQIRAENAATRKVPEILLDRKPLCLAAYGKPPRAKK